MAEVATPPTSFYHDQATGRFAHVYQPPSAARSTQRASTGDYFGAATRKRQRAESGAASQQHGMRHSSWSQTQTPSRDEDYGVLSTESLLVNDRYRLQGGFDTPGLLANTDSDKYEDADMDARRRMQDGQSHSQSTESAFAGPLARERNGFGRSQAPSTPQQPYHKSTPSWTRLALTLPFSIAGKMFSFGGAVLKGFYAGGGQGYEFDINAASTPAALGRQQSSFEPGTPVPGAWHESPPLSHSNSNIETDRPPPNKRRLTDRDTWVMVGMSDHDVTTPPSSKRRISANNTPRLSRPSLGRAGSRRSMLASSRRHSHLNAAASPGLTQNNAHNPSTPTRQSSYNRQSSPLHDGTPLSPETERLRRRQVKQERAADRTMSNMERQLQELIRQGQEALGTKFVVEDDGHDEDEGFVDED